MSTRRAKTPASILALHNARFTGQPDLGAVLAGQATLTLRSRGKGVQAVQQP